MLRWNGRDIKSFLSDCRVVEKNVGWGGSRRPSWALEVTFSAIGVLEGALMVESEWPSLE